MCFGLDTLRWILRMYLEIRTLRWLLRVSDESCGGGRRIGGGSYTLGFSFESRSLGFPFESRSRGI